MTRGSAAQSMEYPDRIGLGEELISISSPSVGVDEHAIIV
jgi:hypothetical protein